MGFIYFLIIFLVLINLLRRNLQVYNFRIWVNHRIYELSQDKGMAWHKHMRREEDTVSYDEMLLKFWKPLHKFYDNNFMESLEDSDGEK